ncbi:MAG: DUF1223 domain-containing protein [Pseudomonadota bacterium]
MLFSMLFSLLTALVSPQAADAAPGEPATDLSTPVVVELFTSQGCPMCPGANAFLGELGEDEQVIAIAYGVDIWDDYGWSDSYARPEFGDRQRAYVDAGEPRRVYTPHFVVNGGPDKLRYKPDQIRARIGEAEPLPASAALNHQAGALALTLDGPERDTPAEVWLVSYRPGEDVVEIAGGPNAGAEISHFNMARSLTRVGDWTGGPTEFAMPAPTDGLASVALVQAGPGGEILAAARIDPR